MKVPNKRQKYTPPSKLTAEERQMLSDYYRMTESEIDRLEGKLDRKLWRFGSKASDLRLSLWAEEDKKINGKTLPGEIRAAKFQKNPTRPGGLYETVDRREAFEIMLSSAYHSSRVWDVEEREAQEREAEYEKFHKLIEENPEMADRLKKELRA